MLPFIVDRVLVGWYRLPGTGECKVMVRARNWKYVFFRHRGREQLFDLEADPDELHNRAGLARRRGGRVARDGRRRVPPPRSPRSPGRRRPQGASLRAVGVPGRADLPVRPVAWHHRLPRAPRRHPQPRMRPWINWRKNTFLRLHDLQIVNKHSRPHYKPGEASEDRAVQRCISSALSSLWDNDGRRRCKCHRHYNSQ